MIFYPETPPFPYWTGRYSPARGNSAGFRIKDGRLRAWVNSDEGRSFCIAQEADGISKLARFIKNHWRGGRILFLPTGLIVKPLQSENEAGSRVVVGRYESGLKIIAGNRLVDLPSASFSPGSEWPGPGTIGLECAIGTDGSLIASWRRPSEYGQNKFSEKITGTNHALIAGFRKARPHDTRPHDTRPHDSSGRVRITVGDHVITNTSAWDGGKSFYVGNVDRSHFTKWGKWIQRR